MGAPSRAVRVAVVAVLAVLACLVTLLSPVSAAGAEHRTPQRPSGFPWLPDRCYDSRDVATVPCRVTRFPGRPSLVLWGDSHAQMYLPPLQRAAERRRFNLVVVVYGGCPVSLPYPDGSRYRRTGCDAHNTRAYDVVRAYVDRNPRTRILIGGFWSGYRLAYSLMERERRTGTPSGLTAYRRQMARLGVERSRPMLRRIGRLGVPVDLIGQSATVPAGAPACARGHEPYRCDLPRHRALAGETANRRWIRRQLLAPLPGRPRIVETSGRYCSRTTCRGQVDGVDTFYDDIHLGERLTATMGPAFRSVVRALTRQ